MKSIEARLSALTTQIDLWKAEKDEPIDPLSQSLIEFGEWLSSLNEQEKADEAAALGWTLEQMEQMIADFGK